jgi:flagellar biogenesis protein FliO
MLEAAAAPLQPPPLVDHQVAPAAHQAIAATQNDRRYLAPPSAQRPLHSEGRESVEKSGVAGASRRIANFGVPLESIYTVLSALALVIGAFLVFAWLLRRGRAISGRRDGLPADVVSVLGRVPLAARQFAELLRVGNKLVLVSLSTNGAETITEVTDPVEVDRLMGLCLQNNPHSATKAFEQVFRQLSSEPAPQGFLGKESLPSSFSSPAGAYRAYRGDAARA